MKVEKEKRNVFKLKSFDEEGNLLACQTFSSVTLKANETIISVFTVKKGKVYVHLEFRDAEGKLLQKTRKQRWMREYERV